MTSIPLMPLPAKAYIALFIHTAIVLTATIYAYYRWKTPKATLTTLIGILTINFFTFPIFLAIGDIIT